MKDSSRMFLENASNHLRRLLVSDISDLNDYDSGSDFEAHNPIVDLYTKYTAYEIDNYEHIVEATNEFFDFLQQTDQYNRDHFVQMAVKRAKRIVNVLISRFVYKKHADSFSRMIFTLSPSDPSQSHILDVGPGRVPYSSLEIATKTKKVSAMDKNFLFALDSLKAMNVFAQESYFGKDSSIDEFDFIVGRFPCSAIPYIVSKCKAQNKPYFLQLCECALFDKNVEILDDFASAGKYSWIEILPDLDPNIKFYEDYAFNIGSSVEQVGRAIQRIVGPASKPTPPFIKSDQLVFSKEETVSVDCSETAWTKE